MLDFSGPTTNLLEGYVVSDEMIEGCIQVKLDIATQSDDTYSVYIVTPPGVKATIPKKDSKGLILFNKININPDDHGYWIGKIYNRHNVDEHEEETNTSNMIESDNKKTKIGVSNSTGGIFGPKGNITAGEDNTTLTYDRNKLILNNKAFEITTFNNDNNAQINQFTMDKSSVELGTIGKMNFRTGGQISYRINNNNFVITGVKGNKNEGEEQYKAIDMFFLKSRKVIFNNSNGPFYFNGGTYQIKLAGGKITGGGGIPGSGPSTTYAIEAIDGDIAFHAGTGDIDIIADDNLKNATLTLRAGAKIMPLQSGLEITSFDTKLYSQTVWGIDSKVILSGSDAKMSAFNSIDLNTTVGDISLDAMANANIKAMISAKIEAATIDIKADIKASINAQILDLTNAKMIKAGPKSVIPTGTGCFQGVKICPILGIPLTGEVAIG